MVWPCSRNCTRRTRIAGDRDVGLRDGGNRGGGDEEGRGGFSAQAVFAGSSDGGGGEGARSPQTARRESRTARSAGPALPVRKHHRQQRADAGDFRHHHARGADACDRAAGGGKRRGQGYDRARDSPAFAAQGPSFRQDQLHRDSGKSDGERAVRVRERRVHRREYRPSPASSSRPIRAPCFWTRSATCPGRSR